MSIMPPAKLYKTFNCPSCGGVIEIRASGHCVTAICKHCASVIDTSNENFKIIATAQAKDRETLLPMGLVGKIKGVDWEVIGYVEKSDNASLYCWEEYLLFNPYHGFRFLVNSSGNWNFVTVIKSNVLGKSIKKTVEYKGTQYKLFQRGTSTVKYVKGEFYWRVKKDDAGKYYDYIAPPYMLSCEHNDAEVNLALAEYISPKEVKAAFGIAASFPKPLSIGATQPRPFAKSHKQIWFIAAIAILLITLLQFANLMSASSREVVKGSIIVFYDGASNSYKLETSNLLDKFTIPEDGHVLVKTSSSVDNDWAEVEISLINIATDNSYDTKNVMEYYHGVDSDGVWAEGSQSSESFIPNVAKGDYKLLINIDSGAFQRKGSLGVIDVLIKADVPEWSNYKIAMFLTIIWPILMFIHMMYFESKRWSTNSTEVDSQSHETSVFAAIALSFMIIMTWLLFQ